MGNDFVEKCGMQKKVPDEKMMISPLKMGYPILRQARLVRHEGF